jgi:hypothetical protein
VGGLLLTAAGVVIAAGPAAAASCHESSCENKSPYSTDCITGSSVIYDGKLSYTDDVDITAYQGHVRLWYSPTCRTAWATIYDIPKASAGYQDYADIARSDGTTLYCFVPVGDTSCYTYMVNDAGYTSHADASDYAYDAVDGYKVTFYGGTGSY